MCKVADNPPKLSESDKQEVVIQIASKRVDGVISKVYKLSRNESLELFRQKKVFINGRLCENNSQFLKEQDKVSVRGYGKFEFAEELGISKTGKVNAKVFFYGKK
jgi:RNA-binding protein YlmH